MKESFNDAHCHVWRLVRGDYGWLTPDLVPLYRNYDLDHLRSDADHQCPKHIILVQAAPTIDETDFLLEVAATSDQVGGVIGWVDFESDSFQDDLERLRTNGLFRGVRPMLADIHDPDWILNVEFKQALQLLAQADLLFEGLARPLHIPRLARLAADYPNLRIVLDHAGKPDIRSGDLHDWRTDISAFAEMPNTYCKLSGLLTEAGSHASDDELLPATEHLMKSFGIGRLMFGSDWPVMRMATSYGQWFQQAQRLVRRIDPSRERDIFFKATHLLYGLDTDDASPTKG